METATEVVDERQDRATALDRFARSDEGRARGEVTIPPQAFAAAGERIIGAQAVAVYRDEARVLSKLKALAAAAGSDWYYRFPVKNRKENRTDWIEGPSIKLANDLARLYGNCDVDVRVMDLGDSWLFYARFTDFETGFSLTRPFQQRKNASKLGGEDDGRRLDIALQIGASKAIRNVVVNALQTFSDFAFEEARGALVEKIGKNLDGWRTRTIERLEGHVALARVERVIGRKAEEWLAPDVARVIAMMKAVADGMASLEDTFPPLEAPAAETAAPSGNAGAAASSGLDQFAAGESTPPATSDQSAATATADRPGSAPAESSPPESGAGPAEDPVELAHRRGREGYRAGMARKAVPPEYRTPERSAEAQAWQAGHDAEKAAAEPGLPAS